MKQTLENQVRQALGKVKMPKSDRDIVALNKVGGIVVKHTPQGAKVSFTLNVEDGDAPKMEPLRMAAELAVKNLEGVASAMAVLTAHRSAGDAPVGAKAEPAKLLPNVKHIIAVASGKGGVGKSTTAVNLAVAMALQGHKIGLLDADIFGPSVPRMMDIHDKPQLDDNDKLVPFQAYGVSVMSIGNLIAEEAPVIWRGPMVHGALRQLLADVAWNDLDVLLLDLPPGTGDAPLTLAHLVPLRGAIIVSTPQDIALLDARKAIGMFQKMNVPVLGIVENMSQFVCPHCGGQSEIFGRGGARIEAEKLGVPLLGELPLDITVRTTSDEGTPIVFLKPENESAQVYKVMAGMVFNKAETMQ